MGGQAILMRPCIYISFVILHTKQIGGGGGEHDATARG
jgi:hypothetical protein